MEAITINPPIKDYKSTLVEMFESQVTSELARGLFPHRLALWENSPFRYADNVERARDIIAGYAAQIEAVATVVNTVSQPEHGTESTTTTVNYGKTDTTTRTGTDTTTIANGTETTKNTVYPTGYTGDLDSSYLSTSAETSSDNDVNTLKHDTTDTNKASGVDRTTVERYSLAEYITILNGGGANGLISSIDELVFEFIKWAYKGAY